jgi:hypothetical protein
MIRTLLALLGLITLGYWLLAASPAKCTNCILTGFPCYGQVECGLNCSCIQPDGLGSKGFCN